MDEDERPTDAGREDGRAGRDDGRVEREDGRVEREDETLARALSVVVIATPPGYVLGWVLATHVVRTGEFLVWATTIATQAVAVAVHARRHAGSNDL